MSEDDLGLSHAAGDLSPEQAERLDALCDRFERAWKEGQAVGTRPSPEQYLAGVPSAEVAAAAWELLNVDLHYRRAAGETPEASDYLARLPMLAPWRIARAVSRTPTSETRPLHVPGREAEADLVAAGTDDTPPGVTGYDGLTLLGHGGMGVVYKARDARLERPVALKFLRADCCRDPAALERFHREARIASALNHPHICTVYALGEHAGLPYLAMEFVEGQTLRSAARAAGSLPLEELAGIVRQVARALAVAHAAGIVHRDVKPENIVVRPDGIAKVLDFGLARLVAADKLLPGVADLTGRGTLLGTLRYMAPEQARQETANDAADVFALGIVFYELATGHHPFHADSELGILHAIGNAEPVPASRLNPELPPAATRLIEQMLAKAAPLRPTATEVDAALTQILNKLTGVTAARTVIQSPTGGARHPTVGREAESAALWAAFDSASAGRGQVRCVTGEPGIGKTTLVEAFLASLVSTGEGCRIARGRCSERLSGSDAYLPILEALDSLARGEAGDSAARALRLVAPAWYAEVAHSSVARGTGADTQGNESPQAPPASSQQRMKRELFSLLEELSRPHPLVLFLDDVHWADASTVDLLSYVGARCAGLRLLLIVTYRPAEMRLSAHPFGPVQLELQRHGTCEEVPLGFLSHGEVRSYLDLAFPNHRFGSAFESAIHANTEGNPLFLVDLLQYLNDRGVIADAPDGWSVARDVPDFQRGLPPSIASLIQQKLSQLDEADRALLSIAAAQGYAFDSAVVARVEALDVVDVEERLASLERVQGLVRLRREHEFPDGTPALRYQFVHVLYQNALYAAMQPARRARSSARLAEALLELHGDKAQAVSGELAVLFEAARDWPRAVDHLLLAAANAIRLFAHSEAVVLVKRALGLLAKLPDGPQRGQTELRLQSTLALQLQMTGGFASADVERAHARARELFGKVEADAAQLFPFLWGSWMFYMVRGPMPLAAEAAERLMATADGGADPIRSMHSSHAMHATQLHRGELASARTHMEREWSLYDPSTVNHLIEHYGHNTGVCNLGFGASVLWLLGYPDQALKSSQESVAIARRQGHPFTLGFAYYFAAKHHQYRGDHRAARELAEAAQVLAGEQGFPLWFAGGTYLRGWALTHQGHAEEGLVELRRGVDVWRATGAATHRPYQLALLAEALGQLGKPREGLEALDEALRLVEEAGEHYWEAEIHRLRGELLLPDSSADPSPPTQARACFDRALAVARGQQAKSLELRAAISLNRLLGRQGQEGAARQVLSETLNWFTEGFDTPDLKAAKALLASGCDEA